MRKGPTCGSGHRRRPITLHGDGNQTRCFTFVDDTVSRSYLAGFSDEGVGQVINLVNLGSERETSIRQLAELIRDSLGSDSELVTTHG